MDCCQLKVIGSGSSGNSLTIKDKRGKYIFVDVGVQYIPMMQSVDYSISKCVMALCGHHHKDHARSLAKFIELGIPCYGNEDVCARYKGCNLLTESITVDGFTVSTFPLCHDVPNNAFVVDTYDGVRFLYCTDTTHIPTKVDGVNCAIIEANWDADIMFDNALSGISIDSQYNNHQSIERCVEYINTIYNEALECVILWHLSNTNISAQKAVDYVRDNTKVSNVHVAKAGLQLSIGTKK